MAGVLDSARFHTFVSQAAKVSVEDVHGFVYGGHTEMPLVPMMTALSIAECHREVHLQNKLPRSWIGQKWWHRDCKCQNRFRILRTPSASAVQMAEAIILDKKRKSLQRAVPFGRRIRDYRALRRCSRKSGEQQVGKVIPLDLNAQRRSEQSKSWTLVKSLISESCSEGRT